MCADKTRPVIAIQDELPTLVRLLREPAGNDPRFKSAELILENRSAFLEKVHATWKDIHKRSLNEILQIVSVSIFEQVPLAELLATEPRVLGQEVGQSHFQNMLLFKDL